MRFTTAVSSIVFAACALSSAAAFAQSTNSGEYYPFDQVMSAKMIDKNHDGMVSRQEFLDQMGMVYDMHAKKMGASAQGLTPAQISEIMAYMRAGG